MKEVNENKINRIAIIGAPGTGKTTLANNLEEVFKLPVVHIDSIHYLEKWVLRDTKQRDKMINAEAKKEKWIMDGTFIDTLEERVQRADLIIFLDYKVLIEIAGIFDRRLKHLGKKWNEIPKLTFSFFWYVFTYNLRRRKYILEILNKCNQEKILVFQKRKDLEEWLRKKYIEKGLDVSNISKS